MLKNLVVISDTHINSKLGLFTLDSFKCDEGALFMPSKLQRAVSGYWEEFWGEFVPHVTKGEPYAVCLNGDAVDGDHHHTSTIYTRNNTDQLKMAVKMLYSIVNDSKCDGNFFLTRGTPAHGGIDARDEESLGMALGLKPDSNGLYSRWLWEIYLGDILVKLSHHISTTQSAFYEATALNKKIVNEYVNAGRWNKKHADVIVSSHRHQHYEVSGSAQGKRVISVVTPGWQLKTPYMYKSDNASSVPQFGGIVIRLGEEVPIYIREKIWTIQEDDEEVRL